MNRLNLMKIYLLIATLGFALFTLPHFTFAQTASEEISMDQPVFFVQGKVRAISGETMSMTVKPNKGKRVHLQLAEDSIFVGFSALKELEKGKRVKVWYKTDGENNTIEKIEKIQELGC